MYEFYSSNITQTETPGRDEIQIDKVVCRPHKSYTTECKEFERDLANNVKSNPKEFWPYCNPKLKNEPRLGDLKTSEGALVQGDKEKMDLLNEYFASVYTQENLENLPSLESKYDGPLLNKPDIAADTVRNNC